MIESNNKPINRKCSTTKMLSIVMITLLILLRNCQAACRADYETMIGGYAPDVHEIGSITFAVDSKTMNLAVGG